MNFFFVFFTGTIISKQNFTEVTRNIKIVKKKPLKSNVKIKGSTFNTLFDIIFQLTLHFLYHFEFDTNDTNRTYFFKFL